MIRKLLVGTVVAVLGLLGSVAEADFIHRVKVTIVTKPAELDDVIKEAERARDNARYAVYDAKEALSRAYRSRKLEYERSDAIEEARLTVQEACKELDEAQTRLNRLIAQRMVDRSKDLALAGIEVLRQIPQPDAATLDRLNLLIDAHARLQGVLRPMSWDEEERKEAGEEFDGAAKEFKDVMTSKGNVDKAANELEKAIKETKKTIEQKKQGLREALDTLGTAMSTSEIETKNSISSAELKEVKLKILFGNRICGEVKGKVLVAKDSKIEIRNSFVIILHENHLRESTSDRAKLRIVKEYNEDAKKKGKGIWDLAEVAVAGWAKQRDSFTVINRTAKQGTAGFRETKRVSSKETGGEVEVELLSERDVENLDARLIFAGETVAGETERKTITSQEKFAPAYARKLAPADARKFAPADARKDVDAIITYEFRFENAVE